MSSIEERTVLVSDLIPIVSMLDLEEFLSAFGDIEDLSFLDEDTVLVTFTTSHEAFKALPHNGTPYHDRPVSITIPTVDQLEIITDKEDTAYNDPTESGLSLRTQMNHDLLQTDPREMVNILMHLSEAVDDKLHHGHEGGFIREYIHKLYLFCLNMYL